MTYELSGVAALFLSGLALLLGQQSSLVRAIGGFILAILLLSASSLGADFLLISSGPIQAMISTAIVRHIFGIILLVVIVLLTPRMVAHVDPIWLIWNMLAISEISSFVYRGRNFEFEELLSSGIAVIMVLTVASIYAIRFKLRRTRNVSRS